MKKLLIIVILLSLAGSVYAMGCQTDWGCVNRCRMFGGSQDSCMQTCTVCY